MQLDEMLLTMSCIKGIGRKTVDTLGTDALKGITTHEEFTDYLQNAKAPRLNTKLLTADVIGRALDKALTIKAAHEKLKIKCITKFDDEYPLNFKKAPDAPPFFFVKGSTACLNQAGVAVIGTREASSFGYQLGQRLGTVLAEKGLVVVSGLALGCDTSAHEGCVAAGKPTVAILSHGLDFVYPKENTELAEKIIENGGCLLSEYPVGTKVSAYNLVDRDRLQACLADALIVIETGESGGTLHAFNRALKDHKPVACLGCYSEEHYNQHVHARGNRKFINEGTAFGIVDAQSLECFIEKIKGPSSQHTEVGMSGQLSLF